MAEKKESPKVQRGPAPERTGENTFSPLVDLHEIEDGSTILTAELPGATAESLDIRVDKGVLTIAADAPVADYGQEYSRTYTGFVGGQYYRAFALSDEIDRERIEASLEGGVLTLRLPKAAAARPRKIEIKAG